MVNLKFWKKDDEDFSDLGDFGLGETTKPGAATTPPMGEPGLFGEPAEELPTMEQPPQQEAVGDGMAQQTFPSSMQQAQPQQPVVSQKTDMERDLELISAKLDSVKATLESVNQRLANLERMNQKKEW